MDFAELERDGYQIVRSVVSPPEIADILRETDRLKFLVLASALDDRRLRMLWSKSDAGEATLRGLQNAHHVSPAIEELRLHRGIGRILCGVLGSDIKTVLTSIFWKSPGEGETGIAYHQDAAFRQPALNFRNLAHSFLQLTVALDPQDNENGGLRFVPGSHRQARILPRPPQSVLTGQATERELSAMGIASGSVHTVRLEPGDIVIWNAFTVHGSPPNRSKDRDRRSFTMASMRSRDCDTGTDAYIAGEPAIQAHDGT
ncbi:phytanoyl-CoA dioxygenase family protein [Dongia deserti]|uniref:phytanoyl-CoA dioxygenase family protein n=1 Tax=Dongia deserti TaxID=2268030 RepID=UPI0013C439D1|nr:phytanoyl-CoA dioxygenase family protein [Dongia deserti]